MTIEQKRQKLEKQLEQLKKQEEEKANFYDNARGDIQNAIDTFIVIYSKTDDKTYRINIRRAIKYLIRTFVQDSYNIDSMESDFNGFVKNYIKLKTLTCETAVAESDNEGVNDNE